MRRASSSSYWVASAKETLSPWKPSSLWRCGVDAVKGAKRVPAVWQCVLGISWFWCLGAILLSFLPTYGEGRLHLDALGVTHYLLCFAIGIGLGSFLGLFLTHGKISAALVPLAGYAMSAFLILWALADVFAGSHLALFLTVITAGIGIAGGVFSVPLYALMQYCSPQDHRGRVISANNIMNSVFMVSGAIGAIAVSMVDSRPSTLLAILAVLNLAASVYLNRLNREAVLPAA